jgi:hypothetical protein
VVNVKVECDAATWHGYSVSVNSQFIDECGTKMLLDNNTAICTILWKM